MTFAGWSCFMLETRRGVQPQAAEKGEEMTMCEPRGITAASSAITVSKPLTVRIIHYEIAHHISGRIRLRIPRLAHDARFAQVLSEAVMTLHLLEHARVSSRASSLVITYREGAINAGENGAAPGAGRSILPQIIECIRVAACADVAEELMPPAKAAATNHADVRRADEDGIDYVKRLGLPVLGLVLSPTHAYPSAMNCSCDSAHMIGRSTLAD